MYSRDNAWAAFCLPEYVIFSGRSLYLRATERQIILCETSASGRGVVMRCIPLRLRVHRADIYSVFSLSDVFDATADTAECRCIGP